MKLAVEADFKANGKKSLDRVLLSFKHLRRHLGNAPVMSITTSRVRRYISERQDEGAANSTIRNEVNALRRGLNLLAEDRVVGWVPKIPTPKVENTRKGFLTRTDVEGVVKHLPTYAKPIVRFAFMTGWRSSEVMNLQWSAVDWEAGEVRLAPGTTKNDEGRSFPFAVLPPLADLLRDQREHTRDIERERGIIIPWVWHRNGRRIKSIRASWNNATEAAGIPGAWFHDLRRSAVRNLERAGVSRSVSMKLTGHETESVFNRYAIADSVALKEGVGKLASLYNSASEKRKVVPIREAKKA